MSEEAMSTGYGHGPSYPIKTRLSAVETQGGIYPVWEPAHR